MCVCVCVCVCALPYTCVEVCDYACLCCVSIPFQTVTGVSHADDVNSYWIVRGKSGENCQRG